MLIVIFILLLDPTLISTQPPILRSTIAPTLRLLLLMLILIMTRIPILIPILIFANHELRLLSIVILYLSSLA